MFDDDPVVQEMPVYMCNKLDGRVNVFRFPWLSLDKNERNISGGVVQEQTGVTELYYELDTNSEFYSSERGENLATQNRPSSPNSESEDETQDALLEKLTLRGELCINDENLKRYMLMIYMDGKVYLNSISNFLRFVPDFSHIKGQIKLNEDVSSNDEDDDEGPSTSKGKDSKAELPKLQPVTVQFSQAKLIESKHSLEVEGRVLQEHFQKLDHSPWTNMKYFSSNNPYSMLMSDQLYYETNRDRSVMFNLTPQQYAQLLMMTFRQDDNIPVTAVKKKTKTEVGQKTKQDGVEGKHPKQRAGASR